VIRDWSGSKIQDPRNNPQLQTSNLKLQTILSNVQRRTSNVQRVCSVIARSIELNEDEEAISGKAIESLLFPKVTHEIASPDEWLPSSFFELRRDRRDDCVCNFKHQTSNFKPSCPTSNVERPTCMRCHCEERRESRERRGNLRRRRRIAAVPEGHP